MVAVVDVVVEVVSGVDGPSVLDFVDPAGVVCPAGVDGPAGVIGPEVLTSVDP